MLQPADENNEVQTALLAPHLAEKSSAKRIAMMSKETNKLTEDSIYSANENGTGTLRKVGDRRIKQEDSVDELYDPSAAITPSG